jgi:hypothetical protein
MRRGERISVVPNIARKVDRLTAFVENGTLLADEHVLDTAIDLYVYSTKYLLFLADCHPTLVEELPLKNPLQPLTNHETNFDQLIDAGSFSVRDHVPLATIVDGVASLFEELWPAVESGAELRVRFDLARGLARETESLVASVAHQYPEVAEAFARAELAR